MSTQCHPTKRAVPTQHGRRSAAFRWFLPALLVAGAAASASGSEGEGEGEGARSFYLPEGADYDPAVPTPASVLGYDVGEWHVRHDQLVEYFRVLAQASPRVELIEYGRTHEQRPLILAFVSSPANLARREEIRRRRLEELSGAGAAPAVDAAAGAAPEPVPPSESGSEAGGDAAPLPVVTWLGYSVHGNESSGANASLLVAYHLAAARGAEAERRLEQSVVLIDPSINPDGLGRFAQWANSHRGRNLVADPASREHRENWPGGRTNHYWFDLNRDWLLLTHPESRARLEEFHRWLPNVLADFHEMGSDATYFFQPGVPSRQNPRTPQRNLDLTRKVAVYHARALDDIGSLYFTEEAYDDFYYGKGSTYPDIHGSVGILFEQASSRGHRRETRSGVLTFPFTIRNQFLTSLSTLEASIALADELRAYQREFFATALADAEQDPVRAYVFGSERDPGRLHRFLDILLRHRVRVHRLASVVASGSETFRPEWAYVVRLSQPQYRLACTLFETRTEFEDPVFYDVSTWTLPLAFGLPYVELSLDEFDERIVGDELGTAAAPPARMDAVERPYAYLLGWENHFAPRAARRLLAREVTVLAATRPFEAETAAGRRAFRPGTLVVPSGPQTVAADELAELVEAIAREDGVDVYAVETGLTAGGIDLGSPNVLPLALPRPALVVGDGVSSYEAGEVWHLLDKRFDMEVSLVEVESLRETDLTRYTHVVLVSGSYARLGAPVAERLRSWVERGGALIALCGAVPWAESAILGSQGFVDEPASAPGEPGAAAEELSYASYERVRARELVRGAIFEARLDRTHPLAFGFGRDILPVFRNTTLRMRLDVDPFATAARYADAPLLSGFASPENLERLRRTPVAAARRVGDGVVVRIVDNVNFRGVWYGTEKLFLNAVFFGPIVKRTGPLSAADGDG